MCDNVQSGILPEGDTNAFFATYSVNYDLLGTKEGRISSAR